MKKIENGKDGNKLYKWYLYGACFGQRQSMKIHVESVHEGRKPFDCTFCQKSFAIKGKLDWHSTTVRREMIMQWKNKTEDPSVQAAG